MIYIYSKEFCSACIELKEKYKEKGIKFTERDGDRLKNPAADMDGIDKEALVVLSMQSMTFPIIVKAKEIDDEKN